MQIIESSDLAMFYKEMVGALLEMVLRILRRDMADERAIMTQVRSSKYYNTARVVLIINCKSKYE